MHRKPRKRDVTPKRPGDAQVQVGWVGKTLSEARMAAAATQPVGAAPARRLTFQELKYDWWWLRSDNHFKEFETNPYCQAFEILRRIPEFGRRVCDQFFPKQNSWSQLHSYQRARFTNEYKCGLSSVGWVKRIWFFCNAIPDIPGPLRGKRRPEILFDCRLRPNYLISALREEFAHPTNLLLSSTKRLAAKPRSVLDSRVETYNRRTGPEITNRDRWLRRLAQLNQRLEWQQDEKRAARNRSSLERLLDPSWFPGVHPFMIHLRLRAEAENNSLAAKKILAAFTTFVKDKPSRAFSKYRERVRLRFRMRRGNLPRSECPRTLALGLVAFDYKRHFPNGKLSCLYWKIGEKGRSLFGFPTVEKSMKVPPEFTKALHNALRNIDRVEERFGKCFFKRPKSR